MMDWARDLFPICRSITGPGVRQTLAYIQNLLPRLNIYCVTSGTKAFGWMVPDEWTIRDAYVEDWRGNKVIDFKDNNLHVVGYSQPVNRFVPLNELLQHIHSAAGRIPYVTSYYKSDWGFCCTEEVERSLDDDYYKVVIDSELKPGHLNYGELIVPGQEATEILLSTYICHPSMANDNISGIVVLIALAQWLQSAPRRHTYRIVFNPETIGSIVYISQVDLSNIIAGYVISRVGTSGELKLTHTRTGNTLADRAAHHLSSWSHLYRASDERQYNSPNVDLPICAISRGEFPEYHSSHDDLNIISEAGLQEALNGCIAIIEKLENNRVCFAVNKCEPQLGKLYPPVPTNGRTAPLMDVLAFADGRDLIDLSQTTGIPFDDCVKMAKMLSDRGFLVCS